MQRARNENAAPRSTMALPTPAAGRPLYDNVEDVLGAAPAGWEQAPATETAPAPRSRVVTPQQLDAVQARGRKWVDEIRAIFMDNYPAFRPNYAECTLLFACMYSISVKHDISPGQAKSLELLRKKLTAKGIMPKASP